MKGMKHIMGIFMRGALALVLLLVAIEGARAGGFAYVTSLTGNTINVIDTATNTIVAQPDIGDTTESAIAVLPNGNFVYVGQANGNQIKVIDTVSHTVVASITVGTSPQGIAALPDSTRLYVTNSASGDVSVIDTETNTVVATIPTGTNPNGVAVNPAGTRAYVANTADNTVSIINTATNTVIGGPIATSNTPVSLAVSPDGTKVYVANTLGQVGVIDTAGPTYSVLLGGMASTGRGLAVSRDGTRLYVALYNDSAVRVLDTATVAILGTIPVGSHPRGVALNADGTRLYVASQTANSVSVINTVTNTVVATIGGTAGAASQGQFVTPDLSLLTVGVSGVGGDVRTIGDGPKLICGGQCRRNYATSAAVRLAVIQYRTNPFLGWAGDCAGQPSPTTVSMEVPRTCEALFGAEPERPPPAWLFSSDPPGSVTGSVRPDGNVYFPSLVSSFVSPNTISFFASLPSGQPLPAGLTFDTSNLTFYGTATIGYPPIQTPQSPVRAADGAPLVNTVYPAVATLSVLPVVITATNRQGESYSFTLNLIMQAAREPVVMAALSTTRDGQAGGNGASARAALSHDGGQVVFQSAATNLLPAAQPVGTDVLRYRALSGGLDRLNQSAFPAGGPTGGTLGPAIDPAVSSDGQYAAFAASGQGLVIGLDTHGVRQIYRLGLKYPRVDLDPGTPTAELVSGTAEGIAGDGHSDGAALSADGRFVAFASTSSNLGTGLDGSSRVWRKDMASGALTLVSAGLPATDPAISADGRLVAFAAGGEIFVRDLQAGTIRAVAQGTRPRLSADGSVVVFVADGQIVALRGGTATRSAVATSPASRPTAASSPGAAPTARSRSATSSAASPPWSAILRPASPATAPPPIPRSRATAARSSSPPTPATSSAAISPPAR